MFVGCLNKFLKLLENQTSTHPSSSDLRTDDTSPTAPPVLLYTTGMVFMGWIRACSVTVTRTWWVNKAVTVSGVIWVHR